MSEDVILKGKNREGKIVNIKEPIQRRMGIERLGLTTIDLEPLEKIQHPETIEFFVAHENYLETIDLSFLKRCLNLTVLYLFSNSLEEIDLRPLRHCLKLQKLSLYDNKLKKIDLSPLQQCTSLKALWLHGNSIDTIDLSPLVELPVISRIGLDKEVQYKNGRKVKELIEHPVLKPTTRSEVYTERPEEIEMYEEDYTFEDPGRSPNDQRSDVMNPNNPEYKANTDNRSNQMNPNNPVYRSSRGRK